jgi:hypothetical protein
VALFVKTDVLNYARLEAREYEYLILHPMVYGSADWKGGRLHCLSAVDTRNLLARHSVPTSLDGQEKSALMTITTNIVIFFLKKHRINLSNPKKKKKETARVSRNNSLKNVAI